MNKKDISASDNQVSSEEINPKEIISLENSQNSSPEDKSTDTDSSQNDEYSFGWNDYAEKTNGRYAMIGIFAILIIELVSNKSFLSWCGILN